MVSPLDGLPPPPAEAAQPHLAEHPEHGIRWLSDPAAVLRRASDERKPIFIAFAVNHLGNRRSPDL